LRELNNIIISKAAERAGLQKETVDIAGTRKGENIYHPLCR